MPDPQALINAAAGFILRTYRRLLLIIKGDICKLYRLTDLYPLHHYSHKSFCHY